MNNYVYVCKNWFLNVDLLNGEKKLYKVCRIFSMKNMKIYNEIYLVFLYLDI